VAGLETEQPRQVVHPFLIECQGAERSFNAPLHLQDSAGVFMNYQVRARLVLRRNCFGVGRTAARNSIGGVNIR
jgi:hypothetical protein